MKEKIKALQDTWLKKEAIDSTLLNDDAKVACKQDKTYNVKTHEYDQDTGHIKVELSYGAGTWFIWPEHWERSWEITKVKLPTSSNKAVQRQIDRLAAYTGTVDLETKSKYFSQRDNPHKSSKYAPWRTCNSSSNAMYLDWARRASGRKGLKDDVPYIDNVFKYGDTIYHHNQTKALNDWELKTKWMQDRDLPFVKALLQSGFPVVVNILHRGSLNAPSGGHVIMLIGHEGSTFTAHDPYGTLSSNYTVHNGAHSKISENVFNKRWQGCYRILA